MSNWTLKINGKTYTIEDKANFEYRSHINGMQAQEPDNWIACKGVDENGNEITAWYYVENPDKIELDSIDYDEPSDIEDEYGKIIYDSEN